MRLAHLTDFHARWHQPGTARIAKRRCRLMPELLEQALERIAAQGAEAIALTGDILDVPNYILDGDDYYDYGREQWERDVEADYRVFRSQLDVVGLPYVVVPGNHDQIAVMRRVFPEEPAIRDLGGYRFVSFWDRDTYGHMPRRFDRERHRMLEVLADPESPPQIHIQHYLTTPILNAGWPYSFFEGDEIKRRVVDSGKVVLSLAGHYHEGMEPIREGRCTFATGPAFSHFPHCYRLYDIDGDTVTMQEHALLEQPVEHGRPAVFLDRDGVLNVQPAWRTGPEPLLPMPGVGAALRRLKDAGYALIVISSQSAVGAGYVSPDRVDSVFDRLARDIWREGQVCWDAHYFSTGAGQHAVHPDFEDQRDAKPDRHYLWAARDQLGLDLDGSFMVGDTLGDLQAGVNAGVRPILVRTGHGRDTEPRLADHAELGEVAVVDDIGAAADWILAR